MSTAQTELPPRHSRKKNSRSTLRKILKTVLVIGFVITFAALCYGIFIYNQADQMLDNISAGTDEVVEKEESAKERPKTILVLGLDSRQGIGTMNTDVIMVVSLNPNDKSASIVSIPRDTFIHPSDYRRGYKANAFYSIEAREDRVKGTNEALANVREIFGEFLNIPIEYVTIVNFKTFEDVIDELGGIMVDVDMDMRYVDNADGTNINLRQGYQELDGKNALDFVRYRHSNDGSNPSSDLERNARQQQVITSIVDQLTSFDVVFKLKGIFAAIGDNIETDIPREQINHFIQTYATIKTENIEFIPIEGRWENPYIYLDEAQFNAAKQKLQERIKE